MDYVWICRSAAPAPPVDNPMGMTDGPYSVIEVAPGERRRLDVGNEEPSRFVHGRCLLRLGLMKATAAGARIESNEFEPQ